MNAHRLIQWLRHLWQPAPIFGLAVIAICWIGLAYQLTVEHERTVNAKIERGSSLARLFEEATIRLIKGVDRTLLFLRLGAKKERFAGHTVGIQTYTKT